MTIDTLIHSLHRQLAPINGQLVVGLSGGRDSVLLLRLLCLAGLNERLLAVHVSHGLQAAAEDWPDFCDSLCRQWGVAYRVETVQVDAAANVEARARTARRAALLQHVPPDGALLLAQHRSDQAETFWLRALRGAGVAGLAGMRPSSTSQGRLVIRPLLSLGRGQVTALCHQLDLRWVDDPTNDCTDYDRNFIRHQLMPLLASRWPAAEAVLARNAALLAEQADLLHRVAQQDARQLGATPVRLPLAGLAALDRPRRHNLLHHWVVDAGFPPPPRELLMRLESELLAAPDDRLPQLQWPGAVLVRFDQTLWLLSPHQLSQPAQAPVTWQPLQPLSWAGWQLVWQGPVPSSALEVGSALLGERMVWRGHHRPLSELWRQQRVPPWERSHLPVVRSAQGVLAAARIGQSEQAATLAGVAGPLQILLSPL